MLVSSSMFLKFVGNIKTSPSGSIVSVGKMHFFCS